MVNGFNPWLGKESGAMEWDFGKDWKTRHSRHQKFNSLLSLLKTIVEDAWNYTSLDSSGFYRDKVQCSHKYINFHYSCVSSNVWKLRKLGPLCCWQNGIMNMRYHSHFPVPLHWNEAKRTPGCWGKTTSENRLYMYLYILPLSRANVPLSKLGWSFSIK